jgi:hypothetical protein
MRERSPVTLPRQRGLTEQAADAAIDTACRLLRCPPGRRPCPGLDQVPVAGSATSVAYVGVHVNAHSRVRMNVQSS